MNRLSALRSVAWPVFAVPALLMCVHMTWAQSDAEDGAVVDRNEPDAPDLDAHLPLIRARVRPGVWLAAPVGDVTYGNQRVNSRLIIEETLDINDPHPSFQGEISFRIPRDPYQRWRLIFDAFDSRQSATTTTSRALTLNSTTFGAGTRLRSELEMSGVGLFGAYDFTKNLLDDADDSNRLNLFASGGLRAVTLDQSVSVLGGGPGFGYDETNVSVEFGPRLSLRLDPPDQAFGDIDLHFAVLGGVGLNAELTTVDLNTGLSWFPRENVAVTAGYRLYYVNLDDSQGNGRDFQFDGYLAGFMLGAVIEF